MGKLSKEITKAQMSEARKFVRSAHKLGLSITIHAFGNWKRANGERVREKLIDVLEIRDKTVLAKVGIGTQSLTPSRGGKMFVTVEG